MNTIKKSLVAASALAAFGAGAANAATIATFNVDVNITSSFYKPLGMELTSPGLPHSGTGTGSLDSDGSISMITNEHLETLIGADVITDAAYVIPSLGGSNATSDVFGCTNGPHDVVNTCASALTPGIEYTGGVTAGALPDGAGDSFTLVFDNATSTTARTFTLTSWTPTAVVPVPAAAWLFGSGLLGLAGAVRRRRSAGAAA